ncbi:amidohydrolase family protein [Bacillus sp. J37]|uniref:amidohydrolase family protein n=1 Tax=Bacillus sp. J37 TaxID=935837 RepID=UPI0004B52B8E|nr:amidohydrolase family protein [Bacillus sp. J37]
MRDNQEELHLYNVRLPQDSIGQLFSITIKNGVYETIQKQTDSARLLHGAKISKLSISDVTEQNAIDVEGRFLLPSFIDIHTHLDKAFSLTSVPNRSGTLQEAIRNYSEKAASFSEHEIKARVRKAALQSLSYGTTHIRTHVNFELDMNEKLALSHLQAVLEVREELRSIISIQVVPMFSYLSSRPKKQIDIIEEAVSFGVDGIGGAPHLSPNSMEDIDFIFQLAEKFGKFIDLHVDEQDDPSICTIEHIIEKTKEYNYQGKVVAGHLCSLSAMNEKRAATIIEEMAGTKIGAVTLPGANMYLQGRHDRGVIRRGITRVKEFLNGGVEIATASDNVNDPFHPFGRCDLLQIGLLTAYTAHLGSESELQHVMKMMTETPAGIYGLKNHGVQEKVNASFVLLEGRDMYQLFANLSPSRFVYHKGRWVSGTTSETQFLISEKAVGVGGREDGI